MKKIILTLFTLALCLSSCSYLEEGTDPSMAKRAKNTGEFYLQYAVKQAVEFLEGSLNVNSEVELQDYYEYTMSYELEDMGDSTYCVKGKSSNWSDYYNKRGAYEMEFTSIFTRIGDIGQGFSVWSVKTTGTIIDSDYKADYDGDITCYIDVYTYIDGRTNEKVYGYNNSYRGTLNATYYKSSHQLWQGTSKY